MHDWLLHSVEVFDALGAGIKHTGLLLDWHVRAEENSGAGTVAKNTSDTMAAHGSVDFVSFQSIEEAAWTSSYLTWRRHYREDQDKRLAARVDT